MHNLDDLVKRYSIRHDRTIKNVCSPLKQHFGISTFTYYKIEQNGGLSTLSNAPEQLDFYYKEKLYCINPYMNHPDMFRSGYAFIKAITDPDYLQISADRFGVCNLFLILQKNINNIEGFLFGSPSLEITTCIDYLHHLETLLQFTRYFKQEMNLLLTEMKHDGYNLQKAKGNLFLEATPSLPLSSKDPKTVQFLQTISFLSAREQECLSLFKQGHSAQSTAAILGLSRRTVEHYFENIKNKLNCNSKHELLNF